jgi:hypothetical protein
MSGVIVVLGVGVVFLSRVFLAFLKEGRSLPPRQVRVYRTESVPPKGKGELIIMNPGRESHARTWGARRAAIGLVFALLFARPLHGRQAPTSPASGGDSSVQEAPATDQPIPPAVAKERDGRADVVDGPQARRVVGLGSDLVQEVNDARHSLDRSERCILRAVDWVCAFLRSVEVREPI